MNPVYKWHPHRTLMRLILFALSIVVAFGFAMLFSKGALAAETSGMIAPGTVWGSFADRALYAVFGMAVAFAAMAAIVKYGAELIAPSFDTAVAIADRVLKGENVTMAEALLAIGILLSTTFRLALVMLPGVIFAVLL